MSDVEIRLTLDEVIETDKEITSLNKKLKYLRQRKESLLKELQDFLQENNTTSIKYKGKNWSIEQHSKLVSKK
jgi:predicted  nucleic acid-binding Zn-ribbon protein